MSVQTEYLLKPRKAYDGLKADMHPGIDVSKTVETTEIEFGRVVSGGSTDQKVVKGGAAPVGIVVRELELEGGTPQVGDRVAVRQDGPLYCLVEGAGSQGDNLNYDNVTGRLTTAAVAGSVVAFPEGRVVLSFDKVDETADVDNIVRVDIIGVA